jgi:hypothetical protein
LTKPTIYPWSGRRRFIKRQKTEGVSVDELESPPPVTPRVPVRLLGLPYILHQQNINMQRLAVDLGVDPRRIYNLNAVKVRAEPWEIDKLKIILGVSLDQLATVPADAPALPVRTRPRAKAVPIPPVPLTDESKVTPNGKDDRVVEANAIPVVEANAIPVLPAGVSLAITLPDGRCFEIASNQPLSAEMVQRMAQALFLLGS